MRTILESVARALVGDEPYEKMTPNGKRDTEERARRVIRRLESDGLTLMMTKLSPDEDGHAPASVRPTSDDVHAWISRAYRDPEDKRRMDDLRFTRWNMEVAFQAGFGAGYRAGFEPASAEDAPPSR